MSTTGLMARAFDQDTDVLPVVIAGPTGIGKSALALALAEEIGGEIVNYDSIQIYRGFDIGSSKPTPEERRGIRHHLIDIIEPEEHFDAALYEIAARSACAEIIERGKTPILVGGTFFYLRAFLHGLPTLPGKNDLIRKRLRRISVARNGSERLHRWLMHVDPVSGGRISVSDRHRLERALEVYLLSGKPISSWARPGKAGTPAVRTCRVALQLPPPLLRQRLESRVVEMFHCGLVDETRALLAKHDRASRPFSSIGYREAVRLLDGELAAAEAVSETQRRTRAYAKRQRTFLRAEDMNPLDATLSMEAKLARIVHLLDRSAGFPSSG
ncbi:MAG TPA: tRNA (adenosine(37)-N6)-dimethylallyltransferase MiaA [Thermoanaerobaculia bacterium]|nr:tRNA (adenosine(37)-N6)-dimethylallyltransferase MiaA [Thermoanaerobaculia bacterium]